jgi:hypothetical protein
MNAVQNTAKTAMNAGRGIRACAPSYTFCNSYGSARLWGFCGYCGCVRGSFQPILERIISEKFICIYTVKKLNLAAAENIPAHPAIPATAGRRVPP